MNKNKNIIDKLTTLINNKFLNKEISSLETLINISENFNYGYFFFFFYKFFKLR